MKGEKTLEILKKAVKKLAENSVNTQIRARIKEIAMKAISELASSLNNYFGWNFGWI